MSWRFLAFSLIVCFILIGGCIPSAQSSHCGVNYGYGGGYNYNYNYGYNNNYQNYNQLQYAIPVILEIPLYSAGYSQEKGDPYALQEVATQLKELNSNIKNFRLVGAGNGTGVQRNDGDNGFLALVEQRCAACHTGTSSKGRFQIFNSDGQLELSCEALLKMIDRAYVQGDMPPRPAQPLSQQEKNVFIQGASVWIRQ